MKLGKLTEIKDLRKIWPNEALDFTTWLAKPSNMELLSDAIGVNIETEETESHVGNFHVDIYAKEADTGRNVIIENQLEATNHDHLGKIITYAAGKKASIIIWVVKTARDEHRAAIEWLNTHIDETVDFFLVETKLYQIGSSDIAVKFEVVEQPNDWQRHSHQSGLSKNKRDKYDYWTAFNEYASNNDEFISTFKKIPITTDHWINLYIGSSLCHIELLRVVKENYIAASIYMHDHKEFFYHLYNQKDDFEKELGFHLEWDEMEGKKASKALIKLPARFDHPEDLPDQFDWMIEKALTIRKVLKKQISQ